MPTWVPSQVLHQVTGKKDCLRRWNLLVATWDCTPKYEQSFLNSRLKECRSNKCPASVSQHYPMVLICICEAKSERWKIPEVLLLSLKTKAQNQERILSFLFCFIYLFICGAGDQTQGIVHTKQEFYHWTTSPDPKITFCFSSWSFKFKMSDLLIYSQSTRYRKL